MSSRQYLKKYFISRLDFSDVLGKTPWLSGPASPLSGMISACILLLSSLHSSRISIWTEQCCCGQSVYWERLSESYQNMYFQNLIIIWSKPEQRPADILFVFRTSLKLHSKSRLFLCNDWVWNLILQTSELMLGCCYDCVVVCNNFPCVGHSLSVALPANICLQILPK